MIIFSRFEIFNAWIMVIPIWVFGIIVAGFKKKGMRRATDISWYTPADTFVSFASMFLMIAFMIMSAFTPMNRSLVWFYLGLFLVLLGATGHFTAKLSFGITDPENIVSSGIYKYSRNPMYAFFSLVLLGTAVASQSIILAIIWLLSAGFTHFVILSEERYCIETYGQSYLDYMKKVPRYGLFF